MYEAIALAIEVGQRLTIERQRCPAREWTFWLEVNCPQISKPTADRYIRLASKSHMIHSAPQLQTLRQAYLLAGIIKPAIPHGQFIPLGAAVPEATIQIEMVSLYFHRWENTIFRKHLAAADKPQLEYWRNYLRPAHDAYEEIASRLAGA